MYNHASEEYKCPICLGIRGVENPDTLIKKTDLVYKDGIVSAFINSFWVGKNKGHVIVVPNKHFENLYEIPDEVGNRVFEVSKKISILMRKAYEADGITIRQNNEPAGDQHAFHYHLHIFPRYTDDDFNKNAAMKSVLYDADARAVYAEKLKQEINS